MSRSPVADGSGEGDAHERRTIDFDDATSRWKWSCPNGHHTIEPTNGGTWCRACSRDPEIDDPHHHELIDKRAGETVPWSAIEVRGR